MRTTWDRMAPMAAAAMVALLPPGALAQQRVGPAAIVTVDGQNLGEFRELVGGGIDIEVVEYRDGSDPVVRKRPGKVKYSNLTLKRGQFSDPLVTDWVDKALAGTTERKSGSIIYLDREGNEVVRYGFFEAWPTRLEFGPWSAPVRGLSAEALSLAVGGLERQPGVRATVNRGVSPPSEFQVLVDGVLQPGVLGVLPAGVEVNEDETGAVTVDAQNLTLLVSPVASAALHQWFRETASGKDIRKNISVVLRASRGLPERRYTFHECWPCRWQAPELAVGNAPTIAEEIEFAVEKVERQ